MTLLIEIEPWIYQEYWIWCLVNQDDQQEEKDE